jgi:hypothetical protein
MKHAKKRFCAHLLLLMGLLLSLALPALASDGGPYELPWYTADSGGGMSSGGSYTVRGTIGQPDAAIMSGGQFGVQGGFWPGACMALAAVQPSVTILTSQLQLSWTLVPGAGSYRIYRSTNPHFAPAVAYATVASGPWIDPDPQAIGDVGQNWYYLVRAVNGCGASGNGQRKGEFDFAIVPGL